MANLKQLEYAEIAINHLEPYAQLLFNCCYTRDFCEGSMKSVFWLIQSLLDIVQ